MGIETRLLIVCWGRNIPRNLTPSHKILSFLVPSADDELSRENVDAYICGHLVAQEVKEEALKIYTDIVARIGASKVHKGKSLRESLKDKNEISKWWYHPVSFKDCEDDATFNHIIHILVVDKVAAAEGIKKLVLWHADDCMVKVLRCKYCVEDHDNRTSAFTANVIRAFASRGKGLLKYLSHWYALRKYVSVKPCKPDVVMEGFWDWSIKPGTDGDLEDRYFKSLPALLRKNGLNPAWFIWFAPYSGSEQDKRKIRNLLSEAEKHHNLIFIQKYLGPKEIIASFTNLNSVRIYLKYRSHKDFRKLFYHDDFDTFPFFELYLMKGFLGDSLPHCTLIAKASERATSSYKPKVALTFLELFPYSRAFYNGVKRGSPETTKAAMQHASYSREKTFVRMDPYLEFHGHPDNCPMPTPNYVFAMGKIGKTIFEECGFSHDNVLLTGSSRYNNLTDEKAHRENQLEGNVRLLMVTAIDRDMELNMVEAVYYATKALPGITLLLRSHPFARIDGFPAFKRFKDRINITQVTLDEDLRNADLVIFSYSTVAEESLIRGIPVWQWQSATYNGSVFRDMNKVVPAFSRVADLKEAIIAFMKDPARFFPTDELRHHVLQNCFYKADGKTSERIAEYISRFISDSSAQ